MRDLPEHGSGVFDLRLCTWRQYPVIHKLGADGVPPAPEREMQDGFPRPSNSNDQPTRILGKRCKPPPELATLIGVIARGPQNLGKLQKE